MKVPKQAHKRNIYQQDLLIHRVRKRL